MNQQHEIVPALVSNVLDIIAPDDLVSIVKKSAKSEFLWSQESINAMIHFCNYIQVAHPVYYDKIQSIHNQFSSKEADF